MAVSYMFNTTQIHLFEYNVLPDLLLTPEKDIQNPDFRFLADKAKYITLQETDTEIQTGNLVCQRFPRRIMRNSSFWRTYKGTSPYEETFSWDLQIPFYLRLRRLQLEILALPAEDRGKVKADLYLLLNSLGWSTHINIVLDVPLRPSQVSDLCNNLRDKAYGAPAYRLNGTDMTLKDIFHYCRDILRADILAPDTNYGRPANIPHLIFVDVIRASGGEPAPFYNFPTAFIQTLARIIRRNDVQVKMQYQEGGSFPVIENMLITEIDPEFYNFSLTDFDQGSFAFMQIESLDGKMSSKPFCYSRNTRDAFLVSYLWLEAYRRLNDKAQGEAQIKYLLESGRRAIKQLRIDYTSRTALRTLQKHKGLGDFLQLDEPDGSKEN
jgi:hypothetical protein